MKMVWKILDFHLNSRTFKFGSLLVVFLILRSVFLPLFSGFSAIHQTDLVLIHGGHPLKIGIRPEKFLEVPQIVWGLNNQKIAFARACLTARILNRTLLMPSLSASLFYKEIELLESISFDKVFNFDKFNSICKGFVRLGRFSEISNSSRTIELQKGSGRKWTIQKDLDQLKQYGEEQFDEYEVIKIVGKNPFLWHDHWPVKDYGKIFECLVLVDEISKEADRVVSKIRKAGSGFGISTDQVSYIAVHMRIEIDWMIHCKKLEQRMNISRICSSKEEIIERVGNIDGLNSQSIVYLAIADELVKDSSILDGWKQGLIPYEKGKLGVEKIYKKYPYLIQSAIDYEVCLRADVFVGNSFSTFSGLIVLERTRKTIEIGKNGSCGTDARWPSYAYNIPGKSNGPMRWMTKMSDLTLQAISYGSVDISC